MEIKITDYDVMRLMEAEKGHSIYKNNEYFGQRIYLADTKSQIENDIANGIYTVLKNEEADENE